MENRDLRKDAIDAVKCVKGELKGLVVFATDEEKNSICIGGKSTTLISLLAGAMIQNPEVLTLIRDSVNVATTKVMADIVTSKLN